MNILILGTKETLRLYDPDYYTKLSDLFSGILGSEGNNVRYAYFDDLFIGIGDDQLDVRILPDGQDVTSFDVVLLRGQMFRAYRDVLKAVSYYAHANNIAVVNDYRRNRDGSKLGQAVDFYDAGIASPYTVLVTPGLLNAGTEGIGIAFPCIMKATLGTRGENNFLISSMAEATRIQREHPDIRFVLQRMIPNEGDFRFLIIGDDYITIKRTAKDGSHLNNTSQGAAAELLPAGALPAPIVEAAQQFARAHGLVTAGVDIIQDKATGAYYFLEVNSQPQLVSGAFLDAKRELVASYVRKLKRQSGKRQRP